MNTIVCRFPLIFLFLTLFFSLAGCGSILHLGVEEKQINAEQYPTPQEFLKNQDLAAKGITEPKLLDILKEQKANSLTQISKGEDVQKVLFGTITPHADKQDIVDISSWILSHHIFSLQREDMRTEFYFDPIPIAYNTLKFGSDMTLLFITERDDLLPSSPYILVRVIATGTQNERSQTKEYVWSGLATAIIAGAKKLIF